METAKQVYDQNFSYSPNESGSVVSPPGELFRYQLAEATRQGVNQGLKQGMDQGLKQGLDQGLKQGMDQGIKQGLEKFQNSLSLRCQRKFKEIPKDEITQLVLSIKSLDILEYLTNELDEISTWEDFLRAKSN